MTDVSEVVVVGQKSFGHFDIYTNVTPAVPYTADADGGTGITTNGTSYTNTVAVNIQLPSTISAADKAAAEQFAQHWAEALSTDLAAARTMAPATQITWDGRSTTAGAVVDAITHTTWVVNDGTYGNGGVGMADFDGHIDTVSFRGMAGYDSPDYPGNSGMTTIAAHEIGHMTQAGEDFRLDAISWARKDPTVQGYQTGGDYWVSLEKFVDDFVRQFASQSGMPYSAGALSTEGFNATPPFQIYSEHVNPPPGNNLVADGYLVG